MEHRAGENRAPIISDDSPNKDINIAFYNIPMLKRSALAFEVCFMSASRSMFCVVNERTNRPNVAKTL